MLRDNDLRTAQPKPLPQISLYAQEVHYNQHGLMLLDGKGIYRLADKWYPIQVQWLH